MQERREKNVMVKMRFQNEIIIRSGIWIWIVSVNTSVFHIYVRTRNATYFDIFSDDFQELWVGIVNYALL